MKTLLPIIYIISYILFSFESHAQEQSTDIIEEGKRLKKQLEDTPFKYGGALNLDFRFNHISGIDKRNDPFNMRINGISYFSFYGVRTAININYSDGRVVHRINRPNIKLPSYAFLGMSPSYKWAKLHLGYRSMQFSPYTLAGNNFYGTGIELSPGKFRFNGFYGRLQRANPENMDVLSSIDPTYLRNGWGFKTGYVHAGDEILVTLFSAKDDPNSIVEPILRNDVLPAENTVISISGKKKISKLISLDIDYAWSAFTRDSRNDEIKDFNKSFFHNLGGLYTPKISTGYHKAMNTGLNFNFEKLKLDFRHERVDPGYRSLGALFFNNDFERISSGASSIFFKNRLNLNARLGFQRNNLSRQESNTMQRLVANISSSLKINERLNMTATFSNFSNTIERSVSLIPIIEIDSIALTQVNRNIQLGANYMAGKSKQSIFNGFISYQIFNSITNEVVDLDTDMKNIVTNISHSFRFTDNKGTLSNSLVINKNNTSITDILTIIPSHSFTNSYFNKKLMTQYGFSNAFLFEDGSYSRHIFQIRLRGEYKLTKKISFGLQGNFTKQSLNNNVIGNNFNETSIRCRAKIGF